MSFAVVMIQVLWNLTEALQCGRMMKTGARTSITESCAPIAECINSPSLVSSVVAFSHVEVFGAVDLRERQRKTIRDGRDSPSAVLSVSSSASVIDRSCLRALRE